MPKSKELRAWENECEAAQQPLEIGKVYPDTWGRPRKILGHPTKGVFGRERELTQVYCTANHYHIKTGKGVHGGQGVINLPRELERMYFKRMLYQIFTNNDAAHLKLVYEEIYYIRTHIKELEDPNWQRRTEPPPPMPEDYLIGSPKTNELVNPT